MYAESTRVESLTLRYDMDTFFGEPTRKAGRPGDGVKDPAGSPLADQTG